MGIRLMSTNGQNCIQEQHTLFRPFLNNINKVRILIGIDVDKYIANAHNKGQLFFGAEEEVKQDYLAQLRKDIEHSNYSKNVEEGIFQLVEDLVNGKLELRAHPSKKIHAKIYLLYPEDYNEYTFGAAITGSSNLSGNGLGISLFIIFAFCQFSFNHFNRQTAFLENPDYFIMTS